ncbi:MAG TPA: helix-turn-helix transcriptional regulator [Terracidiphilus sp.]|jgi:DNA-binding PadR family transcriptional regulator
MSEKRQNAGQNAELGIWEIAVLTLLRQGPMHPYQMRRLLKARHKDEILSLRHGSLYHAIGRLERAGRIVVEATSREGKRPERTTYRITEAGEVDLLDAVRKMIAVPRHEANDFMAAVSSLVHLEPGEARLRLEERCSYLGKMIAEREGALTLVRERVPRIHLVESEYLSAMQRAELEWARGLAKQIESGELNWDVEEILRGAAAELGAEKRSETDDGNPGKRNRGGR